MLGLTKASGLNDLRGNEEVAAEGRAATGFWGSTTKGVSLVVANGLEIEPRGFLEVAVIEANVDDDKSFDLMVVAVGLDVFISAGFAVVDANLDETGIAAVVVEVFEDMAAEVVADEIFWFCGIEDKVVGLMVGGEQGALLLLASSVFEVALPPLLLTITWLPFSNIFVAAIDSASAREELFFFLVVVILITGLTITFFEVEDAHDELEDVVFRLDGIFKSLLVPSSSSLSLSMTSLERRELFLVELVVVLVFCFFLEEANDETTTTAFFSFFLSLTSTVAAFVSSSFSFSS